jgi:hypothetical protein
MISIHIVKNNKVRIKKCTLFRRLIMPVIINKKAVIGSRGAANI